MKLIAVQPYIKVQRQVNSTEQIKIEHERHIYMYSDKILTAYHEFQIQDVLDISYRSIAGEGGLLYIHTNGGLYSYTVNTSPKKFIDAFNKYREM